jgi:hypothetical protein
VALKEKPPGNSQDTPGQEQPARQVEAPFVEKRYVASTAAVAAVVPGEAVAEMVGRGPRLAFGAKKAGMSASTERGWDKETLLGPAGKGPAAAAAVAAS